MDTEFYFNRVGIRGGSIFIFDVDYKKKLARLENKECEVLGENKVCLAVLLDGGVYATP